ncbi:MAG: hypothetical protein GX146_04720 [Myxococcales bacterium]|nr:hypothetical protein [Myxococcales bacterium]
MRLKPILVGLCSALFSLGLLACAQSPGDGDGSDGNHGFNGYGNNDPYADADLDWRQANLTWFESYPDPGSDECINYNGCTWAGHFAYFYGEKQSESWVANTHIAAVHQQDFDKYRGKILRIRQNGNQIDAKVYDLCADRDCNGCCTRNSAQTGFLIDLELHTYHKLDGRNGVVEWACLDCD